jgi:hypothetical protein
MSSESPVSIRGGTLCHASGVLLSTPAAITVTWAFSPLADRPSRFVANGSIVNCVPTAIDAGTVNENVTVSFFG